MAKNKKAKPKSRIEIVVITGPKVVGNWSHCYVDGKKVGCASRGSSGEWSFFHNPHRMQPGTTGIADLRAWLEREFLK